MALFRRRRQRGPTDTSGLGHAIVALRLSTGDVASAAPAGAVVVIVDASGHARRSLSARMVVNAGDAVLCFHPGPYTVDLIPFAAAPELGLRVSFVIDAADPRVTEQRFDLFLFSEAGLDLGTPDVVKTDVATPDVATRAETTPLTLERFALMLETALRLELGLGNLDLPACTSHEEWTVFRAGLNQLLYTRFGITVEDCLPADLGESVDFAAMLARRASSGAADVLSESILVNEANEVNEVKEVSHSRLAAPALQLAPILTPPAPEANNVSGANDCRALRRLFLELPALTSALRLIDLPVGQPWFQARQLLLHRLDLAAIAVATMPSLVWATPERHLDAGQQARRAAASVDASAALDQAWSLLARLQLAGIAGLPALFDDGERILANLEQALALRRMAVIEEANTERREPT